MEQILHPKAQALLDAQVAYILKKIIADDLHLTLEQELDLVLANAPLITLSECVSSLQIKQTVHRYAIELDLGAGVFDIMGDIARRVHGHHIHQQTTLNEILSDRQFEQVLDKILELKNIREYILREVVINPVYASLASDVVYYGLRDYLLSQMIGGKKRVQRVQSVLSKAKDFVNHLPQGLEEAIEDSLRLYINQSIRHIIAESQSFLTHIDQNKLRDSILDIWDNIKQQPISTYQQLLTSIDVEELCVMSYEFWRDFRQTTYFKVLLEAGIDAFFQRYGDVTLDILLEEVGIKRDMLLIDAVAFAPPILKKLGEKNLLEPFIRRHLHGFYASEEVQAILLSPL
ncbi:MAG TPA: hypothetical protein PLW01_12900 [Agitococcus sp.]|nr:hypothetical protein [Agitococcus sp.]